ncbi:MAG: putative serine/threonine kinase anti-sigma factor [Acidimicrobiales bacterium]|nr:putative serine/threonine kinase anti-sigma factor [Acidimicrobiales bacterium]
MSAATTDAIWSERSFRHEALLYSGDDDFLTGTVPFIVAGVDAGEPVLVVVNAQKIKRLREALGGKADAVQFADMADVGANPARIIPAWRDFVDGCGATGRRMRGIGEPIWAERRAEELVECQRHEALLNAAFATAPAWWLLCPYDTQSLPPVVIDEARRTHPYVFDGGSHEPSVWFAHDGSDAFDHVLPEPAISIDRVEFDVDGLDAVRAFVAGHAARCGMGVEQCEDLIVAVNEVATNSLRHGNGQGRVRVWEDGARFVCEIADGGKLRDQLVGRLRPSTDQERGRGIWLVNHLCDLVQIRSFPSGTVVRLHMALR